MHSGTSVDIQTCIYTENVKDEMKDDAIVLAADSRLNWFIYMNKEMSVTTVLNEMSDLLWWCIPDEFMIVFQQTPSQSRN